MRWVTLTCSSNVGFFLALLTLVKSPDVLNLLVLDKVQVLKSLSGPDTEYEMSLVATGWTGLCGQAFLGGGRMLLPSSHSSKKQQDWNCQTHPNRHLFPLCLWQISSLKPQIIPFITNEKLESRNICYFCTRKKKLMTKTGTKLICKSKLSNKNTSISLKNPVWVELPQFLMFIAYFFHFNLFENINI